MTKNIVIKGVLSSMPLIIIAQIFFTITSNTGVSENYLIYIKPLLYGAFLVFAIGLPVYFYLKESQLTLFKLILMLAVSWSVFSIYMTCSAFAVYPGLAKDIEASPVNSILYFLKWFITGTVLLSLSCTLIGIVVRRLFLENGKKRG